MNRNDAWNLLTQYNDDPFHLHHAQVVEGVMKYFAKQEGFGDEAEFWGIVGLLHDLDFGRFPAEHCIKQQEIMREHGVDPRIILAPLHPPPQSSDNIRRLVCQGYDCLSE